MTNDTALNPAASALGRRLRARRTALGLNQETLAAKVGASRGHISRLEKGDYFPSMQMLDALAEALGVVPSELLGERPMRPTPQERGAQLVERAVSAARGVPLPIRGRVPGGVLTDADDDETYGTVWVASDDLRGTDAPFGLEVAGGAMRAAGIFPGDIVIVDRPPERTPRAGEIVAVRLTGEIVLARWHYTSGGIELRDGDDRMLRQVAPAELVEVIGFYVTYKPRAPR